MKTSLGLAGIILAGCSVTTNIYDPASYRGVILRKDSINEDNHARINRYELIIETHITRANTVKNIYFSKRLHAAITNEEHYDIEVGGREMSEEKKFLGRLIETVYYLNIDTAGFDIDKNKYPPATKYVAFERPDTIGIDSIYVPKRDTLWFDGKRSYKPTKPQAKKNKALNIYHRR